MSEHDLAAHSSAGLRLPVFTRNPHHGRQHLPGAGLSFGPNRFVEPQSAGGLAVAAQHGGKAGVLGLQLASGKALPRGP